MGEHIIWNELGNVYMKIGAFDEAITAYQEAIKIDPSYGWPYSNLAFAHFQKGNYAEAIPLYQKGIDLLQNNSDRVICWNRLGDTYRHLQDYNLALEAYRKADQMSDRKVLWLDDQGIPPSSTETLQVENHSTSEERQDKIPEAIPQFTDDESLLVPTDDPTVAVEGLPEWMASSADVEAWDSMLEEGLTQDAVDDELPHASEKRLDEPAEWLRELLKEDAQKETRTLHPASLSPKRKYNEHPLPSTQVVAEASAGENQRIPEPSPSTAAESAQPLSQTAVAVETPPPPEPYQINFDPYPLNAASPEAAEAPVQNRQLDRSSELNSTGYQDKESVNPRLAEIEKYEKIVNINENNDRAWDSLGKLYKLMGCYKQSIEAFQNAIALAPHNGAYHYNLGLVYSIQNKNEAAIESFQNAVTQDPEYVLAHGALAGCYRRLGREEEANRHIELAMPLMKEESEYNQACFNAICGNTNRAIELLRLALIKQDLSLEWLQSDPDLECIRSDHRYLALLREAQEMIIAV